MCACTHECESTDYPSILASVTYTQPYREQTEQYLVDIDTMFLHVVPVVDLPPLSKLHGQDPLCGQMPVDHGNLRERDRGGEEQNVAFFHKCFICITFILHHSSKD